MIKSSSNLNVDSSIITLSEIVDKGYKYRIPLYQRLYVWGDDQVQMLLEDIERACIEKQAYYYIGGVMTTPSDSHLFDLIDGQQRFTTLWLICNELKGELLQFTHIQGDNNEKVPRLLFAIRDFANSYFTDPEKYSSLTKEEKAELSKIDQAQRTIKHFFEGKDGNIQSFRDFVYNKVKFIHTRMPFGIDENRLFEVLNNRGMQLQHHEILKARFLELLTDEERYKYGILWEACSNMDSYIEKNIKELTGLTWNLLMLSDTDSDIDREVNLPDNILDKISNTIRRKEISLLKILNEGVCDDNKPAKDEYEYDSGKVRSIISFPMFLIHTLRVYLSDLNINEENVPEVNEKKLLEIFKKHFFDTDYKKDSAKSFIELLWKLRVKFDKFVVKWVDVGNNEEHHLIKKLYLNKKILQRRLPESNCGFALLQSMLYHSQQIVTLYWLTPFLKKMLVCNDTNELYLFLRQLDNQMFSGANDASLSLRSWYLSINKQLPFESGTSILSQPKGTRFWSYWFYKLEFILWFYRNDFQNEKNDEFKEWDNYRMTKKNSVEHISPQTPKEYDTNKLWCDDEGINGDIKKERLDSYGNLVLLSVGLNSEYSNKTFSEKKTTFSEKKRLDSLKSDLIFKYEHWNWQNCKEHQDRMIQLFNKYLSEQL
ncbi:DUF262 domain-containing protein [Dysgonomonas sp. ZJ279]|uniref:DUF262 domain-containing protein n=1 Tax=Dysgonomonas sp. ZJ279 TaxID=2709796 RepID=UPI0013EC1819|nr:DUF262 domain-containing protein [Dysgonomonas sp. ZJ279]